MLAEQTWQAVQELTCQCVDEPSTASVSYVVERFPVTPEASNTYAHTSVNMRILAISTVSSTWRCAGMTHGYSTEWNNASKYNVQLLEVTDHRVTNVTWCRTTAFRHMAVLVILLAILLFLHCYTQVLTPHTHTTWIHKQFFKRVVQQIQLLLLLIFVSNGQASSRRGLSPSKDLRLYSPHQITWSHQISITVTPHHCFQINQIQNKKTLQRH